MRTVAPTISFVFARLKRISPFCGYTYFFILCWSSSTLHSVGIKYPFVTALTFRTAISSACFSRCFPFPLQPDSIVEISFPIVKQSQFIELSEISPNISTNRAFTSSSSFSSCCLRRELTHRLYQVFRRLLSVFLNHKFLLVFLECSLNAN